MGIRHTVAQGECLSSIAKAYGFPDYRRIYDHPDNAEFKKKRPNPNVIHPGDVLIIPDKQVKELPKPTAQRHKFKLKAQKTKLRLRFEDDAGKSYASVAYELEVDGKTMKGNTDGNGKLEHDIPAGARAGHVQLFAENGGQRTLIAFFSLELGHLDPVEEATGVQARLNNLGFDCGAVDGVIGPHTQASLQAFQEKHGLPVTGSADKATRDKLRQLHDWE